MKKLVYYETFDTIKNELTAKGQDKELLLTSAGKSLFEAYGKESINFR